MSNTNNSKSKQSTWDTINIEVTGFNPYVNNTLKGYIIIELEKLGLEIKNIGLHKNGSNTWITLPQTKAEKTNSYYSIMDFFNKKEFRKFQEKVLEALNIFNGAVQAATDMESDFSEPDTPAVADDKPAPQEDIVKDDIILFDK